MVEVGKVFEEHHWLGRLDEYQHVKKLLFGIGAVNRIGELGKEVAENSKALLVTDEVLVKIGLIDKVREPLEDAGFSVEVYTAPAKEPTLDDVNPLIEHVRKNNYGLIVGVGGGANMDRAKFAAVMAKTPGKFEEYLAPNEREVQGSLPKILIPTTHGTGSECSNTAVVIVPHEKIGTMKTWITGPQLFADVSIVDPTLMLTLPPRMSAGSGFDALSHNAEGVLSIQANPFSDALALKAIELVAQNLRTAYHQGENIEARWNMALAATIGGVVISYPWVAGPAVLAHVASEGISAKYGIPHGEACGVLLPYVYWYNLPDAYARGKLALIAQAMEEDVSGLDLKSAAKRAITATFDLLEDVGLPTSLEPYGVQKSDIPLLAEYIYERAEEMYSMSKYNPRKATIENLKEFFEVALAGREALGL